MPKTKATKEIEKSLYLNTVSKRIYGCEEVTIGFHKDGHGNEIVDFCTMDSKGIIRCYEIKVTLSDLKSRAKKSWYGHYNYLVMPHDLVDRVWRNLDEYIPEYVGVATTLAFYPYIQVLRQSKKQELDPEVENMMKESMIRSMFYKMAKYRDAADVEAQLNTKRELAKAERDLNRYYRDLSRAKRIIDRTEKVLRHCYGHDVVLEDILDMGYDDFPNKIKLEKKAK